MKGRTCPHVLAFLRELLQQAEQTELTEVFLWMRAGDGSTDYQYLVQDPADMLFELGSVILREREAPPPEPIPSTH